MPTKRKDEPRVLSAATIGELNCGAIGMEIDEAIREAQVDIMRRPELKKARQVVVTLTFAPVKDRRSGATTFGQGIVDVKTKVPGRMGWAFPVRMKETDQVDRLGRRVTLMEFREEDDLTEDLYAEEKVEP